MKNITGKIVTGKDLEQFGGKFIGCKGSLILYAVDNERMLLERLNSVVERYKVYKHYILGNTK